MKISVIVTIYNRLEHFRALFLCLLRQNRQPDELIISDDGSSEKVIDYIEDLIPKANFKIKHVYQEDKGFRKTRALNNGVRESSGNVLVFCDQDLIFSEDYLEKIENLINKKEYLIGRGTFLDEDIRNRLIKDIEKEQSFRELISFIDKKENESVEKAIKVDKMRRILNKVGLNKRGIRLSGFSYALMKENYIKVNGYDEKYQGWGQEDDDFGNRLYASGLRGRELVVDYPQIHLWHYFDPSKKKSLNEDYYYERKKIIFRNKEYECKYGYKNSIDNDKVIVEELN